MTPRAGDRRPSVAIWPHGLNPRFRVQPAAPEQCSFDAGSPGPLAMAKGCLEVSAATGLLGSASESAGTTFAESTETRSVVGELRGVIGDCSSARVMMLQQCRSGARGRRPQAGQSSPPSLPMVSTLMRCIPDHALGLHDTQMPVKLASRRRDDQLLLWPSQEFRPEDGRLEGEPMMGVDRVVAR
jgi:hypothetical protein